MKKLLSTLLSIIMIITIADAAYALESNEDSSELEIPTADDLLLGYENTTGVSDADNPVITSIEQIDDPVPHIKVMVTIGSLGSFNLHLTPEDQWEGRFYQLVHPTFVDRNVTEHNIGFSFDSGAYTLQTSGSSFVKMGITLDAAAAHISRTIAKNYYSYEDKIYGYIYGGSGGSMQVVGAMETTDPGLQVWDGAVPYITASPVSLGNFNIRLFARMVLEDKAQQIADAVSPGGSGDPYEGLTEMESEVLREVTNLGLPLDGWQNYEYLLLMNNYATLEDALENADIISDQYNDNFWNLSGYLGTEDSELGELFRSLKAEGYNADGLAAAAYHRHIDPGDSYYTWNHLKDSDGTPLYAQIGGQHSGVGTATFMSGGAFYNGKINMKVIMVQNLMDVDSFPTDGDWYRQRVIEQGLEDNYRIWLNQYADHQEDNDYHLNSTIPLTYLPDRLINYVGSLEQALRDLSAWVEDGVEPLESTSYNVVESQLIVAEEAEDRNGIQPVVKMTVNGGEQADIAVGGTAGYEATVQVPTGAGEIVSVEWDLIGDGDFIEGDFTASSDGIVLAKALGVFTEEGTYFPQVRVTSQREGDTETAYARVENLGRVRVVVDTDIPLLYTVTYDANGGAGGKVINELEPSAKHIVLNYIDAGVTGIGQMFMGWNTEEDGSGTYYEAGETLTMNGNISLYAQWEPMTLITTEHVPYIYGYPDGSVQPDGMVTRAEAVTMFFNLLDPEAHPNKDIPASGTVFTDIADGAWYTQSVEYLASIGVLNGYPDGSFKPNGYITRAEFLMVASKFDTLVYTDSNGFIDVEDGHWAGTEINSAYIKGWISGYPQGDFQPESYSSRAEAVSVINLMLNRSMDDVAKSTVTNPFKDLSTSHWGYGAILEASVNHDYVRDDSRTENWIIK